MKKNYLDLSNNDTRIANEQLTKDLNSDLVGKKVDSIKYGQGTIKEVEISSHNENKDIRATIQFENEEKAFLLGIALKNVSVAVDEDTNEIIKQGITEATIIQDKINSNIKEAQEKECAIIREREEQRKEEERIKKAEIKMEAMKKSNLKLAKTLSATNFVPYDNFYIDLGYLAKNASNITAAMPDYLDKWFVKTFGNVPHKSVDQSKKTPSGLPPQFALALKIDLKTNANMPVGLIKYLGDVDKNVKPISNTQFVFSLVRDFGFKFGKEQDLDAIMENIPSHRLDDFRLGLNLV